MVKTMTQWLIDGKRGQFDAFLVTRDEFDKLIYPHMPEAKQANPISANQYWGLSTYERSRAIGYYQSEIEQKQATFHIVNDATKIKTHGPVTLIKGTEVVLKYQTKEKKQQAYMKYNQLFGVIVKSGELYKVLGVFSD